MNVKVEKRIFVATLADRMYRAYIADTDGKSAVTGAALPVDLDACPQAVRRAWIASAQRVWNDLNACITISGDTATVELMLKREVIVK